MAVRKVIQVGDFRLRAKAAPLALTDLNKPKTKKLLADLVATMRANNLVGIAAPQFGESVRIFVSEIRGQRGGQKVTPSKLQIYINPRLTQFSRKQVWGWEGCGSVSEDKLFAKVRRSESVTVTAVSQTGKEITKKVSGLLARIVQHEYDHLNGILFLDRPFDRLSLSDLKAYRARKN